MKQIFQQIFDKDEGVKHGSGFTHINKETYKSYNKFRPDGPKSLFCYVPFNNISFSFEGRVLACAYNQKVELGKYPDQSVREMWFDSVEGNTLREHLEHNDLSYGCKHCKYFFDNEKFSGLKPLVFDKYSNNRKIHYPRVMEFELSNQCNYECVMCNGKVSSAIREKRDKLPAIISPYGDKFVEELEEFIPHLKEAKFYGGEPFLIPIYFKIWEKMLELNPKIKIFVITNGSALNNKIKNVLERGDFDVAVSMDSMNKDTLEGIRINARQDVMLKHIDWFNDYCKRKKKSLVISFTLMRNNWMDFKGIVEFCNKIEAILYVSYLKTPPQFALWNLPSETLEGIREEVRDVDFPAGNYVEKQNRQVYKDFQTYMDHAIETNRTRSAEEIIPLVAGQTPLEAIGIFEEPEKEKAEQEEPVQTTLSKKIYKIMNQDYDPKTDYRALLEPLFAEKENSEILERVDHVINNMGEQLDFNKVFYEMSRSDFNAMINYMKENTDEQLVLDIKNVFGA